MIEIFHNPRCGKSREGLNILEDSGKDFIVRKYMDEPMTLEKMQKVINLLKIQPIELIRQNESLWKENFKDKNLSDKKLVELMIEHPKLMQRPIVVNGNQAVVGRPPSKITDIL